MPWPTDPVPPEVLSAVLDDDTAHQMPAEKYLRRLTPHFPRFGITRLAEITGLDIVGFPVAQAVRPMARSNAVTQGKAHTLPQAALGAVLECLEMAAGEVLDHLPDVPGTNLELWSRLAPDRYWPDGDTRFVPAWDLSEDRLATVPRDMLSTDFACGSEAEQSPILRMSVGLGAGATLASALMHGLCEAIEADARNRAERSGLMRRIAVDPRKIGGGTLLDQLETLGVRAAFFDMSRGPLVTIKASIMEQPGAGTLPLPAVGYAARFDPDAAIEAAFSEAIQARLAVISGAREDITQRFYAHPFTVDELEQEWARHGPDLSATSIAPKPRLGLRALAQSVAPIFAVPLVWEPETPLAITRILAPCLATDPHCLDHPA